MQSVFEAVEKLAKDGAVIDVLGVSEGAEEAVAYLDQNWERWESKVRAICVGLGFVWDARDQMQNGRFMEFWSKVCLIQCPNPVTSSLIYSTTNSAPVPISSIMNPLIHHYKAAKSSAAIASLPGKRLSRSASCLAPTRACWHTSSLSMMFRGILKRKLSRKETVIQDMSVGRKESVRESALRAHEQLKQ